MAWALGKMFFDLTPDEGTVQQHIGAVRGVNRRAIRLKGVFRIHHKRQGIIGDADFFGGVFGKRACFRNHGNDPFAGVACLPHCQRMALNQRRIKPVHQRIGRSREFFTCEHIVDARHRQRRRGIDRNDAGGRMLRRQDCHMEHAFERNIGHEMAMTGHETAILADPAVGRDKAEGRGIGGHFASKTGSSAFAAGCGVLVICRRAAANSTASMICP